MPIFIPILIIVGAGLAGAGIGVAVDAIIKALKGKRLAVLGGLAVGKTVLINFLTKGTFSKKYKANRYTKKAEPNDFQLKDLKLRIKESKDVSGDDSQYGQWKDIVQKADIVLYLLRTDKLMEGDKCTEERVKRDIGLIGKWLKEYPKKFPLFIIGTYCDLMTPDLTMLPEDKRGAYENKIRGMPIFQEIALRSGGGRKVKFIFGSLKSQDTTESLVYEIIDQVVNHNE
ncbi:MAG: hypothetical protein OXH16_13125 [Gemmatimonadetes bacterium]|nr:hypothetical protein [Gemmatimonadota bacterium]